MMSILFRAIKERPYVNLKYFINFVKVMGSVLNKLQREVFGDITYSNLD